MPAFKYLVVIGGLGILSGYIRSGWTCLIGKETRVVGEAESWLWEIRATWMEHGYTRQNIQWKDSLNWLKILLLDSSQLSKLIFPVHCRDRMRGDDLKGKVTWPLTHIWNFTWVWGRREIIPIWLSAICYRYLSDEIERVTYHLQQQRMLVCICPVFAISMPSLVPVRQSPYHPGAPWHYECLSSEWLDAVVFLHTRPAHFHLEEE